MKGKLEEFLKKAKKTYKFKINAKQINKLF
jgi:hypothetical protein